MNAQADKPVLVVQQLFNIGGGKKQNKNSNLFVAKEISAVAVKHVWQEEQKHQEIKILVSHLMTKKKKKKV